MSAPAHRTHESPISPFRVVVVVVLVAAGLIAWQLTRPSGPAYRTALVSTGTAVASLSSVGTVTPVNQANLSFDVAGTVSAVDVTVGQQVTAGETVASLDSTPLQNTVIADQASLASAQATLASDEASQTASTTTSTTTTAALTSVITSDAGDSPPTSGGGSGGGSSGGGNGSVAQLQAKLVAAQKQEDADSAAASAALATATSVCTASSTTTSTTTPPTTTTSTTAPPTTLTCTEALSDASAAQATLTRDIATVASDEAALTTALEAASSSTGGTGSTGGSGAGSSTGSTGSANAGKSTGGSGSAGTSSGAAGSGSTKAKVVTAQKLALDQANIDVAQANLDSAQQSLASANLVSTISGTVGSVTLTVGSSVTAGSSSTGGQVVVLGSGASYQVVATVPVASISKVAIGQQALVTPDLSGTAVPGTVTGIGVLATAGSTSTTYPVTISIQSSTLGLFSGAEAEVSIVTGKAVDVTTVPTSAVRTVGTIHVVTEVNGTTTKQLKVTTGIVGAVLTQITSGVSPGQQVSIATMDLPVPSSSTTITRAGFGGLGGASGFPTGAGGFGGGFGGATPAGSAVG